ncbi:hypothetical protein CLV58_13512 [Spirosoma oryzae]|uniref:Uncharacterized protein n=1 Tax=Spirosoma oryzae TaxID=1469603 RepID=A0A2T0S0T5_9BACT|nr:hypothetical protein CLV58_13512 [Spirosoma oryzae]
MIKILTHILRVSIVILYTRSMLLVTAILALVLEVNCQSTRSVNPAKLLLNILLWPVGQMPDSSGAHGPLQISSTGDLRLTLKGSG